MGASVSAEPQLKADPNKPEIFDPLYGFPEGRKKKGLYAA